MKNFIKQRHIPHWGLVVFMVLLNCVASIAQEEPTLDPELTIVSQPDTISIASKDGVVNLSFVVTMGEREISYQWYQSPDKTTENGVEIEGATESSYTTEPFSTKEIRYYYCVASADEESVTSKVAAVAYTGLPILYVNTPNGVDITSKVVWTEETKLTLSDAEDASWNFENITTSIRGRGNTTWTQKKKPYALKLDKKQEIMGMPKHKRWVLIANYLDNSFLKNHMAFYLSEKLEMDYTVHGKFVNLIFNGVYRGLYWLGEAIKVDENRVNINDGSKKIKDDEDKDYLIEMDKYFDEPVKFKSSIRQMPYMIKNDDYMVDDDGNMTSGGSARLERLQAKIDKLEKMLYPDFVEGMSTNNCSSPNEIYTKIIDVDSWTKFWLVNEMMDNGELGHPKSAYFTYESKTDIFKAGPVWDFDWASLSKRTATRLRSSIYYNALFKSPLFKESTKRVWNGYSSSIDVETEIETMRDYLRTAANVDKIRWGVHLDPSKVERVDFDAYVDFLKDVLTTKIAVVDKYVTQSLPQITIVSPTIALSNESFEYNGTENKPVVTITDDEHSLTVGTDYTISYYDNVNAGAATVVFAAKGNYAGLQEKTFTISPKPVTLNVASDSKTYGENDPAFDYSVEGLVSINNVTEVLTGVVLTRESGENAGEYAITATVDAAANPNYDVAINNGVLTINPDDTEITVAISGLLGTVTYDGSEKTVHGFSMTSNNDAYSLDLISYTGDSTALGTNAGSYPMGLSAKDFQNTSTNFTNVVFEVTDGNLVVQQKPILLTVADVSKSYGEDDPTLGYSVEGLVSINDVSDELSGVVLTRESGEDAGEYAITATVDATANPNYDVAINNGVLTINPDDTEITVTISGHSGTVTYDGSEKTVHGFSMTSNSEAYSLDLVSYTGDSTTLGLNAGTYPMGLSAKDFQNTSTNFTNVVFEVTDGNLVVQQKPILLTVADVSKSYGEDDPTLGYSVEGLVSVNDVTDELAGVVLTRESGEDAGEYAITATVNAAANPNYVISKNNGTFTITPKTTTYAAVKILEDQNGKRIELDGAYTGEGLISIPDPIEVNSVDFKRNLQAGIPSTVMLPISLPEGTTVNAKYYQIQNVGPNGKGGWKAIFTYIGDGNLPQANTPYAFILNEGENKLEFNLNGGVATVQTDEINNVDDESGNWYFKGTYAHKEWNQDDDELGRAYAFAGSNNEGGASKGQFGKIVDGAWANPMRAYLCKKDASLKPSAVLARSFAPGVSAVAGYSSMALPESIDIEFVDKIDNDEKVLATGRLNTRTGEFQILRKYDLKGRLLNGSPRARGAYYGKKTFKK